MYKKLNKAYNLYLHTENFENKSLTSIIKRDINNVFLFWEGEILDDRLEILLITILSINYYNPDKKLYLFSNSLDNNRLKKLIKFVKLYNMIMMI